MPEEKYSTISNSMIRSLAAQYCHGGKAGAVAINQAIDDFIGAFEAASFPAERPIVKNKRKVIQIMKHPQNNQLLALADDGTVWQEVSEGNTGFNLHAGWHKLSEGILTE